MKMSAGCVVVMISFFLSGCVDLTPLEERVKANEHQVSEIVESIGVSTTTAENHRVGIHDLRANMTSAEVRLGEVEGLLKKDGEYVSVKTILAKLDAKQDAGQEKPPVSSNGTLAQGPQYYSDPFAPPASVQQPIAPPTPPRYEVGSIQSSQGGMMELKVFDKISGWQYCWCWHPGNEANATLMVWSEKLGCGCPRRCAGWFPAKMSILPHDFPRPMPQYIPPPPVPQSPVPRNTGGSNRIARY